MFSNNWGHSILLKYFCFNKINEIFPLLFVMSCFKRLSIQIFFLPLTFDNNVILTSRGQFFYLKKSWFSVLDRRPQHKFSHRLAEKFRFVLFFKKVLKKICLLNLNLFFLVELWKNNLSVMIDEIIFIISTIIMCVKTIQKCGARYLNLLFFDIKQFMKRTQKIIILTYYGQFCMNI